MRLGLGTGSTARHFVDLLGERVRMGLDVIAVPTSEATRAQAAALGIALTTLDETPELDLTVDGADEIAPDLTLIKGGGGALLREKIVASASAQMIVIADASKFVPTLGRFPLPIEIAPFGATATRRTVEALPPNWDVQDRRYCARAKTAMFSSRMAGTGCSTLNCSALPTRRLSRPGFLLFLASWNTACSSASRRLLFSPVPTGFASSSGPDLKHKGSAPMIARLSMRHAGVAGHVIALAAIGTARPAAAQAPPLPTGAPAVARRHAAGEADRRS